MLEFHDDFIRLDERPKYALRFNIIDNAGLQTGPFFFQPWPKNFMGAVSESEPIKNFTSFCSHGCFAVPLEKHKDADDVVNDVIRKGESHGKNIALMLVQYYESDVISFSDKPYTEIVLRQGNIIKTIMGKDFFKFLENEGDCFIKDFENRQKQRPFKTYARKIEDWTLCFKKLEIFIKQDKKNFLETLLFISNFIGQFSSKADPKIISYFPYFMVIMENWKKEYKHYKDWVCEFVQSFKRDFSFDEYMIRGIIECVICCLDGNKTDILECAICQDAYYCAIHVKDNQISRDKLNLDISYMAFNGKSEESGRLIQDQPPKPL